MKMGMIDIMLAREVSDMDFLQVLQQSAMWVHQHLTISSKNLEYSTTKVVIYTSSMTKTVIYYQYEFATTQLGSKTLRKGAA